MDKITSRNKSVYARQLIGKIRHAMFLARQKELHPYFISPRQYDILEILHKLGRKSTLAELAKYSYRDVSTLSGQLTKMEQEGLLAKTREKPKSALISFELTKKGFDIYKKSNKMKSVKSIMSVLSTEELPQLISMLEKILTSAENYQ
jgi:DNA-binding MarR family transcriptional regulator